MKKAFYMMAAAAIALSSCSSEETTDVAKSSNITFRSAVGFNTRGIEMTNADGYKMTKMTVSAFDESGAEFFKNYVFNEKMVSLFLQNIHHGQIMVALTLLLILILVVTGQVLLLS